MKYQLCLKCEKCSPSADNLDLYDNLNFDNFKDMIDNNFYLVIIWCVHTTKMQSTLNSFTSRLKDPNIWFFFEENKLEVINYHQDCYYYEKFSLDKSYFFNDSNTALQIVSSFDKNDIKRLRIIDMYDNIFKLSVENLNSILGKPFTIQITDNNGINLEDTLLLVSDKDLQFGDALQIINCSEYNNLPNQILIRIDNELLSNKLILESLKSKFIGIDLEPIMDNNSYFVASRQLTSF